MRGPRPRQGPLCLCDHGSVCSWTDAADFRPPRKVPERSRACRLPSTTRPPPTQPPAGTAQAAWTPALWPHRGLHRAHDISPTRLKGRLLGRVTLPLTFIISRNVFLF